MIHSTELCENETDPTEYVLSLWQKRTTIKQ